MRIIFGRGFNSPRLHQPSLCELRLGTPAGHSSSRVEGWFIGDTSEGWCRDVARRAKSGGTMKFYYAYILQSKQAADRFYTGFTEDLSARLGEHNACKCAHTSKYAPWRIKTAVAFTDRQKALEFERYLKSPSGRAFAKKRL